MLSDVLFHPSHIVPASKLKSAFVKFPHHTKSQMLMKMYAASCQIFIPGLRHSDTRFHILDTHSPQFFLQCCIQSATSRICILGSDIVSPRSFFNKYSTKGGKWAIVRARLGLVGAQPPALLTLVNNSIAGDVLPARLRRGALPCTTGMTCFSFFRGAGPHLCPNLSLPSLRHSLNSPANILLHQTPR